MSLATLLLRIFLPHRRPSTYPLTITRIEPDGREEERTI